MEEEAIIEQQEEDGLVGLTAEWKKYCTLELMQIVHEDLKTLWKRLLEKAGIKVFDTLTSSFGKLTIMEKIEEGET